MTHNSTVGALIVLAFGLAIGSVTAAAQPASEEAAAQQMTIPSREGVWGDIVYGAADAPVELIEYGSLTCPACASFALNVVPRLMEDFINQGQLRFVFRNFVRDRYDLAAASASRCIADEEGVKKAIDELFAKQEAWLRSENPYQAIADIVGRHGLEADAMGQCISDEQVQRHIVEMRQQGQEQFEVNATPTLVLNGVPMMFPGYDRLKLRIETQIATQSLTSD